MKTKEFFYWIEERHNIHLKRSGGQSKPWSSDEIFQTTRFCNPFRENDKTTVWFRENLRENLRDSENVFMATVIFRWFNYIPTGEILKRHKLFTEWDSDFAKTILANVPKLITGAYIIKTPDNMTKLDGISWCIDVVKESESHAVRTIKELNSLQKTTDYLLGFPFLGKFMSYEIATDLRHTHFLENANDIMTWANPGPGAKRGLNRLYERDLNFTQPDEKFVEEMRYLLSIADEYLPNLYKDMEMRDIEHSLCEFDKYERVKYGGRAKNKFDGISSDNNNSLW